MGAFHIENKPHWYDDSGTVPGLYFFDTDIEPIANIKLSGIWEAPSDADYYWGTDRIVELNNTTYKPNNPYAYGSTFMVDTDSAVMADNCVLTDKYNYDVLQASRYQLYARYGVSVNEIVYVPVSVMIARNPSANREYYLELHMKPGFGSSGGTGSYVDSRLEILIRSHDNDTGTDSYLATAASGSGYRMYATYTPNYKLMPFFASWYNGDSESPSIVYKAGFWYKSDNSPETNIRFATGSQIVNNGHTFYQLAFDSASVLDMMLTTSWESSSYEYFNPTNRVAYDQYIDDEMGPYGPETDPDGTGYPTDQPEGHGDDSSDTIEIPDDPLIGVTNVGFVNVYKTGVASLQDIGVELFPDLQYTNPTPISGSADVIESIENGFNSIITALANIPSIVAQQVAATLINYIIDCHVLPVTPTGGTPENIKVGYKTLSATGDRLSTDYVPFDCGTIKLGEYYGSFADFMTSAKLFLPFVGFVPARPEWFYADTLGVKYKFNVIDGSFVAYVTSTGKYVNNGGESGTVIAQYSGNACVHLPITGVTYASMVSGLVGAGAGAVASAGSGNIAGVASSVSAAAGAHGDIPQSNAYASSGAFLSVRRPYLMIERPVTNYTRTFRKERGLPSNISKKLSDMRGFTILQDIHLDGITATDAEKKELEDLLSKGVIF